MSIDLRRCCLLLAFAPVPALRLPFTRRELIPSVSAAALLLGAPPRAAHAKLSNEEALALEDMSRLPDAGTLLPSGLRVIDLQVGDGPKPALGDRVYVHFKVFAGGFDTIPPVTVTWAANNRPAMWFLGKPDVVERGPAPSVPTTSIPPGIDAGVLGMREGGWRRLVIPAELGYGEAGLLRPTGRGLYLVPPNQPIYVDLRLMDGGSGRCDQILRIERVPKSISCVRGKV